MTGLADLGALAISLKVRLMVSERGGLNFGLQRFGARHDDGVALRAGRWLMACARGRM